MMQFIEADSAPLYNTGQIKLYGEECFEGMRRAGRIASGCLDMLAGEVVAGVLTSELDDLARCFILDSGVVPATMYYRGYRHSSCISVNHVVCHGIPGSRRLKDGDIVNIDVTVFSDGWHGDTSRMYAVGRQKRKAVRLMDVAYECLERGISVVRPGAHLGDIGAAIQEHAESRRCSVVEVFCGHGLGRIFHDAPNVLHFGKRGEGVELRQGMLFTIEPMVNLGEKGVSMLSDGWTAVTRDRSLSAQFEHSIGVTQTGCEVFTRSLSGLGCPHRECLEQG